MNYRRKGIIWPQKLWDAANAVTQKLLTKKNQVENGKLRHTRYIIGQSKYETSFNQNLLEKKTITGSKNKRYQISRNRDLLFSFFSVFQPTN